MKLEIELSREVLEDVFVTALEGGSNYWYYLSEDTYKRIRKAVRKSDEPYIAVAMLKAVLDHGVEVAINDAENEEDELGWISKETMQARLQDLYNSDYRWALEAHLNEEGDSESADIVFQYIVIGEAVFG
jgi:hypothetical protein